jgi:hypothetical protein
LYAHKVDLVFGAHHHSYQRTCPGKTGVGFDQASLELMVVYVVYQSKCTPGAPVIVDLGMAGMGNS